MADVKKGISIEKAETGGRMALAEEILSIDGIAIVAAGSCACVRSLYFTAVSMGKAACLFYRRLSAKDYSLGRQERYVRECIEEAVQYPEIEGIVIYASCLDILTNWDAARVMQEMEARYHIPVEILYRGPLTQRKGSAGSQLERIKKRFEAVRRASGTDRAEKPFRGIRNTSGTTVTIEDRTAEAPEAPDFEKLISILQPADCDILLLTPGGCRSCMTCQAGFDLKNVWYTKFSDICVCNGEKDALAAAVLSAFPENRTLVIAGSAVPEAVGMDIYGIVKILGQKRKNVVYLESNGFTSTLSAPAEEILRHLPENLE